MTGTTFGIAAVVLVILLLTGFFVRRRLKSPIRRYTGPSSVSAVYDQWTTEKMVEFYWGEHLHAGYYGNPVVKKDFRAAKVDLIDEIVKWAITRSDSKIARRLEGEAPASDAGPVKILDVGCGIGGTSRHLAKRWPAASHVTGITISDAQLERATLLARAQNVDNVSFLKCDANHMAFPDSSFDIIWSMEMEMHMSDKERFVRELVRVLKPGGLLIIIAWNVRDTRDAPLSVDEAAHLQLLVDEWCHAKFVSIREYVDLLVANDLTSIAVTDWTTATLPSWRAAVWAALRNPRGLWGMNLRQLWGATRDAYTILRLGEGFRSGLCEYGIIRGERPESGKRGTIPSLAAATN